MIRAPVFRKLQAARIPAKRVGMDSRHNLVNENNIQGDYTFRFRLEGERDDTPVHHDRLAELVRVLMHILLDVVTPLKGGDEVKIDGFKWIADRGNSYDIFPGSNGRQGTSFAYSVEESLLKDITARDTSKDSKNASFHEPRIVLIKKTIESLLTVMELEYEGQPVKVDGFRLNDLRDWMDFSPADPSEIFEYAGTACDCDCVFCCNKGNPPSIAFHKNGSRTSEDILAEINTRIKHFAPDSGKSLFRSIGTIYEVLSYRYCPDILRSLRNKSDKPFRITTNGRRLSPETVSELAEFKPIYIYLSLNSSSESRRRELMRDPKPEVAINSLPLLKERGIPYAAVIVPWPLNTVEEMMEDLSSTIRYAAAYDPHIIQVNLPGYSRYFAPEKPFDSRLVWEKIISGVRELREQYDCPIVTMPVLYEENLYEPRKNLPKVLGVVRNSPAARSGMKRGDIILRVNNININNRPQARDVIHVLHASHTAGASITVQRGQQNVEMELDLTGHSYPYCNETDDYLGVIFMGSGLRTSYLEDLRNLIEARQARHVLFLSSELVRPTFEQSLAESRFFDKRVKIDIRTPRNNFFGGNICMGDLLVVQDFIDAIEEYVIETGGKPDLVVIPSSPFNLSEWGRDLTGRVYLDIERETGIPLQLLHCSTIYS